MITYPTYQAAKIANPDSNIYRYLSVSPLFTCESECDGFSLQPANSADYCMTANQFLNDGHNLEFDDIILNRFGEVVYMNHWTLAEYGVLNSSSHKTFILKSEELEKTNTIPTETLEEKEALDEKTYRYEKVTDSIFDLKAEFERGELYFAWAGSRVGYDKITDEKMLICRYEEKRILRRIEVTERELFIDTQEEMAHKDGYHINRLFLGWQFDNGVRLVNGKR